MRKKLIIGAISLLGIVLILIFGVFFYIRSGRLDLFLQNQIIAALAQSGIRAEIGGTRLDIRGYKVSLQDIKLYTAEDNKLFGTVERLDAVFSVASYFGREVNITNIDVVHPRFDIVIDETGRSNIASVHPPPESTEKQATITFLTALVTITRGELNLDDRVRKITAHLPDFTATFNPKEPAALEDTINHALNINFEKASATYEGRKIDNIIADIQADVTTENAKITTLKINSDLGELAATGEIPELNPYKYDLKLKTNVNVGEVARVFSPDTQASGNVTIDGTVKGTDANYNFSGDIVSGSIAAEGFRVANIEVKTDVTGSGAQYSATADLRSGPINGPNVSINSVRLTGATLTGNNADFDVSGGLALDSLKSGRITVSNLRGRLAADNQQVSLSQFSAAALGGTVAGNATVAYGGGASRVDVQFRSLNLNQAAELASARDVTVRGTANGSARLSFPGLNYQAATGRIDATFDAAISAPQQGSESAPATGQIALVASGRGFNIERAFVRSAASEVTATGAVAWNGTGTIDVEFRSQDMAEVQRVADSFGLIPDNVRDEYGVNLTGRGEFTGRIQGRLAAPTVTGRVMLENIRTNEEVLGSFEGNIAYSPGAVSVEDAALVRPDGSRADFSLNAPLSGDNNISLKANVQSFSLPAIVRAVSPGFADLIGGGTVDGTIDLRGLPGPRTLEGTANLKLTSAEFIRPADEEGQEGKRISVPEFVGNITIANSILSVRDLQLEVGGSNIEGQGSFNLDTYEYSVNAQGQGVDLGQVAAAFSDTVAVTGTADVNVVGQGTWKDWQTVNLNATIQGKTVRVNGRDLGDAKLVAFTENGLLKLEATGTVLDEQRTLAATIDLRDRNNLPVSANIEFTDTELGPYLGLIDPGLSSVTGVATGTIRIGGSLLTEGSFSADRVEAVATLTRLELGSTIAEGRRYTISNQGPIIVTASAREVTLNRVVFTGEGTSLTLEGSIAREGGARSNLAVNGEINLRFLSSFTSTVFTTGLARVEASIVGSLQSPQLLGSVNLQDVGVRVVDFPLSVARGNGQIRFTADQAIIENFKAATPGGGTVELSGGAALAGLVPQRWRVDIDADQVGIEFPRDTQTVFDASLNLQGNQRVQVLAGNVHVRRSSYTRDLTIEDLLTQGGPFGADFLEVGPGGGGGGVGAGPRITLDLRVDADNTLVVRNNLADAVGSAFINIRGAVSAPVISGRVQLTRGTLEFRSGRHELTRGVITLPGRQGAQPVIDFQAEADISGYRITTSFTGPLDRLETSLRSDPELPESDIISLVLTGNLAASDQSTIAAATQTGLGLAQSLLSASLSEQLEKGTQRLFGISRFSIDPLIVGRGNDPTARITLGQRITKNLTVTYSQNLTSGGTSGIDRIVLVEYRLSNRFSVVGYRNERGELGFDVRVRKRF